MKVFLVRDFKNNSFGKQAEVLEKGLKERGHYVVTSDKEKTTKVMIPPYFDDYIYYTIFNSNLFWKGIPHYGKNIVFDVSDTDKLSNTALYFFKQQPVDIIITPSQWAKQGFNGVKQPIYVIPHALDPKIFSYKPADLPHPCVLAVIPHSWDRKGGDIVTQAFRELKTSGYKAYTLITAINTADSRLFGLNVLKAPLPDEKFYSIMAGCDILFYPVRGGAFEIPVFEALALGLDVVVTEGGAWSEWILSKDDVYWIKSRGLKRFWYTNLFHVGNFLDPDYDDAYQKLIMALADWYPEKKKENLENRAILYRERYHYMRIVEEWEKIL